MITKPFSSRKRSMYLALTIPLMVCLCLLFGNYSHAQQPEVEGQQSTITKAMYYADALFAEEYEGGRYQLRHFNSLSKAEKELLPFPGNASKPLASRTLVYFDNDARSWEIRHGEFGPEPPPPPKPPVAPEPVAPKSPPVPSEPQLPELPELEEPPAAPTPPKLPPSISAEVPASPVTAPMPPKPPKASKLVAPKSPPAPSEPQLPELPEEPVTSPTLPPLPPPPPSFDVEELINKGAEFYKDGKRITDEEARKHVQSKKSIKTLNVKEKNGKIVVEFKTKKKDKG